MDQVSSTITLSKTAIARIERLVQQEPQKQQRLRIYIIGGGCSGFQYGFKLDQEVHEDDVVIPYNTIEIIVDGLSLQYMMGAEIDYLEDLKGSQFKVNNPNAESTCGCGSSFSLKAI